MKKIFLVAMFSFTCFAVLQNKGIYGVDNRIDVEDHPNSQIREFAKSVAGRVYNYQLTPSREDETQFDFYKMTYGSSYNLCEGERFREQNILPSCSGFLVGKDILVTAGHCIKSQADCDNNKWVFDYTKGTESISKSNAYSCKEVITQEFFNTPLGITKDYAVIRLDRNVEGRNPLEFRARGKIRLNDDVFVIGHPSGLPLKIADDGQVKATYGLTFRTNLDTYGGNSGSPVFNERTSLVEGILIQGDKDFTFSGWCARSNLSNGKKEKVFKINKIKKLKEMLRNGEL